MMQVVDAYVSSYQVAEGRPYPYMIYRLMEVPLLTHSVTHEPVFMLSMRRVSIADSTVPLKECGVMDVSRVAKIGDSARDIQMGKNAGCGLVIGVLSGADSEVWMLISVPALYCNVAVAV